MTEFTITSDTIALVAPINSHVDRVFVVEGKTFFTTASHPAIGIQVPEPSDLLVQGAKITISPQEVSGTYKVKIIERAISDSHSPTKSSSPTRELAKQLHR